MATIDMTEPVGRVRLAIADYSDPVVLPDETIQIVLDKHNGNETATIKECAGYILGSLCLKGHVRIEKMEIWGSDVFNNYLKYLDKVINSPTGAYATAGIYAGGTSKSDMAANWADPDVVQHPIPSYDSPWYNLLDDTTYGI